MLRRIDIINTEEYREESIETISESSYRHLSIFYSSLTRALSFPRRLDEVNSEGKLIHWSPYDKNGKVYSGTKNDCCPWNV